MTLQELIRTQKFQSLDPTEKQRAIREIKAGDYDISAAPSPDPSELVDAPERTGSIASDLLAPARESMGSHPTWTEQYLPESFATRALSGVERGLRLTGAGALSILGAPGKLVERASEQAPTLVGEPARSTPISKTSADVPGLLAAGVPWLGRLGKLVLGDVPVKPVSAAETMRREAARVAIPLTRAESTLSPTKRLVEGVVESVPFGGGAVRRYKQRQLEATERAARGVGEQLGETRSRAGAGEPVAKVSEQEVNRARAAEELRQAMRAQQAGELGEGPIRQAVGALGPGEEAAPWMAGVKEHLKKGEAAARNQASELYKDVERLAGDAPIISLRNVADEASQMARQEGKLGALARNPEARVAGSLQNLALEFVEQYGLNQVRNVDFETANLLDQRLTGLIDAARGDASARQLRILRDAVRKDIDAFAADSPGDVGRKLREAREFYRTRVGPFDEDSAIRTLRDTDAVHDYDRMLFDPHAAERTQQIKAEILRVDPNGWQRVERRFGEHLLKQAIDPTTGVLSPQKFAQALHKYPPEALNAILGDRAEGFNKLRAKFQAAARGGDVTFDNPVQAGAVFKEFAGKNHELIVGALAERPPSDLAAIKEAMNPTDWEALARSWWQDVVLNPGERKGSFGNTDVFSRERFLTQLKNTGPERLRLLLGDETADYVETLKRVLSEQERIHRIGANPSGSGTRVIGAKALVQAAQLGGAVLIGNVAGITAAGAAVLTPAMLAQFLVRPKHAKLLLDAVQAAPGTRAAQTAVQRLAILSATLNRSNLEPPTQTPP